MLSKWFGQSTPNFKIGFQDVGYAIQHLNSFIIINTLPANNQDCLIKHTLHLENEEKTINQIIEQYAHKDKILIIYGKNATDQTVDRKFQQLQSLGFSKVYIYSGGLFEWIMLQDIYGTEEFPTTKKVLDILQYKPPSIMPIL